MRDILTFTVSDARGAKQFTLSADKWRILLLTVSIVVLIWLIGVASFYALSVHLTKINEEKQTISDILASERGTYVETLYDNDRYLQLLEEKEIQLNNVSDSLAEIENFLHLDNIPQDLEDRLVDAQSTLLAKRQVLQVIPSDYPILSENPKITSKYGNRIHPIYKHRHFHSGIDYRVKRGEPIVTTANGIVEYIGSNRRSGKYVRIAHSYGFKTYYAHLDKITVKRGQVLAKGSKIGEGGSSGASTGPHLHYEVSFLGKTYDPMYFIEWNLENYDSLNKRKIIPWHYLVNLITQSHLVATKQ